MIGIIIAMEEEFALDNEILTSSNIKEINNQKFYEYKNKIIFTYCGIGKVNASISTFNLISNYKINHIINIGTSGSISNKLSINDLIVIKKFLSYDVDLTIFGYKLGQIPKEKENFFYFESNIHDQIIELLDENNINFKTGNISSGDTFIYKDNVDKFPIFKLEEIICVDMESWSIAFVCNKLNCNLTSLKIISDEVNSPCSKDEFNKNIILIQKEIHKLIKLIIHNI